MDAKLVIVGGRANRREVVLVLPTIIGRSHEATLTIGHPQISRKHCMIFEADGLLFVRDLGSTNGTFFDGKRVLEAALLPDQTFTVGPLTFRVSYEYQGDVTLAPPPQLAPVAHTAAVPEAVGPWSMEPAALDSQVLQVPIETGERHIGPPPDEAPDFNFDGVEFEPVADAADEAPGFDFNGSPDVLADDAAEQAPAHASEPTIYTPEGTLPAPAADFEDEDEEEPEPTPPPNLAQPQVAPKKPGVRQPGADEFRPGSRDEITLDDFFKDA